MVTFSSECGAAVRKKKASGSLCSNDLHIAAKAPSGNVNDTLPKAHC